MILIGSNTKSAQAMPPKGPERDPEDPNRDEPEDDVKEEHWVWKPDVQYTFLPEAPGPEPGTTPEPPSSLLGEEMAVAPTPIEEMNETMDPRELIVQSLYMAMPLRISYITLDGTYESERTVRPDYVYYAGTNRHILVAWDELRNDWRAFAVDNISQAKLLEA
jgi:hypothetical protein